ncbi:MAG: hypothetical protein KatS3mg061_3069 [Dehalococcoidia bacterium]|nr:MAG: hypothetical protein KatS3mg061_3069 [Dehalococcoidia bacterium]
MAPLRLLLLLAVLSLSACRAPAPQWERDEQGLPGYALATGLAVGPDETVYVAVYREGAVYVQRPGEAWSASADLEDLAAYAVAAAPTPGLAFAGTVDGVYRTEDDGRSWQRTGPRLAITALLVGRDGVVWAGGEGVLLRSEDGGRSWQRAWQFDPLVTVLGLAEGRAGLVLATAGAGLLLWRAGQPQAVLPLARVVSSVAADAAGRLVARSEGTLWRSESGEEWTEVSLPVPRPVVAVGAIPEGLLATSEGAGVFLSRDGGQQWRQVASPLAMTVYAAGGRTRVWAATAQGVLVEEGGSWRPSGPGYGRPLVRGLATSDALLAATSDGVYRREAEGWRPIGSDLRGVLTLFVLPAGRQLFAGTWERGVVRSTDGGASWETVTEFEYQQAIIPQLARGGETLLARVEYDRTLRSDGGERWALADEGLMGRTVFALASDGQSFWAGTDAGVFWLDGARWRALAPLAGSVTALLATPTGLVAGTTDGLFRWQGERWQPAGLAGRHVVALLAGADGQPAVAGTSHAGVFRWRGGRWELLGLVGERVNSLARDPASGELVVATERGVWRLR